MVTKPVVITVFDRNWFIICEFLGRNDGSPDYKISAKTIIFLSFPESSTDRLWLAKDAWNEDLALIECRH